MIKKKANKWFNLLSILVKRVPIVMAIDGINGMVIRLVQLDLPRGPVHRRLIYVAQGVNR